MVVDLLQPVYLWGLLGLLIPIVIHLLHKRSQRVLMVGSLQAFRGGAPVQARKLRPNELLMLLLRCLLLTLFVLLLAQPMIYDKAEADLKYLFVAPAKAGDINADSLKRAGFSPHLLQPGLAPLEGEHKPDTTLYSYWDVFQEIEGLQNSGDTIWLYFNPTIDRFSGKRPQLTKTYEALPLPEKAENKKQLLQALRQPDQKLLLTWWQQQGKAWQLEQRTVALADSANALQEFPAGVIIQLPDTLKVALYVGEGMKAEALLWQKALLLIDSLQPATVMQLTSSTANEQQNTAGANVAVWLANESPRYEFKQGSSISSFILSKGGGLHWFRRDDQDHTLYHIQYSLVEQQNNRQRLAAFLPALYEALPLQRQYEEPLFTLPEEQWKPAKSAVAVRASANRGSSLEPWVWIALLLTFITERWLSLRK